MKTTDTALSCGSLQSRIQDFADDELSYTVPEQTPLYVGDTMYYRIVSTDPRSGSRKLGHVAVSRTGEILGFAQVSMHHSGVLTIH